MWTRGTNMRKMSWIANQIIESKEHEIFVHTPSVDAGFFCPQCGVRDHALGRIFVYLWTLHSRNWQYTKNDIMCEKCHNGVQERIVKRLAKRNNIQLDKEVVEFRKSVKRLKAQLKVAKKVGIFTP